MTEIKANGPTEMDLTGAAVLFDLDGTLVDTADDLAASMNHALTAAGHGAVPAAEVRHLVGYGARRMLMRGYVVSTGREAAADELDLAMTRFLDHYQAHIADHSRPFAHVVEMIVAMKQRGARFAICTNKREALARRLLEALGLSHLFDSIVGADTAEAAKPDAAPVRLCLEQTGAMRAVFIGDSDTDILAAAAAGLPSFIADFGYGPLTLASKATAIFSSYRELPTLIDAKLQG